MMIKFLLALFVTTAFAQDTFDPSNKAPNVNLGSGNLGAAICPISTTLADGCVGSQAHGTFGDVHLADAQKVIDLNVDGGSSYSNGTYTWTSSGGGCSVNASGTITVSGGMLGGATRGNLYTITNEGSGCTSKPTISVPAGAGGGSGGAITPTVYQLTPHNASGTIGANWNVAGVDYPVGYDTSLTLKDPTTASLPSGCTFSSPTVTCAGSGGTLNGYDFTLHNTKLSITASGWTISNNSFICGPHGTATGQIINIPASGATSVTFKYNNFNGGNTLPSNVANNTNVCDTTTIATMIQSEQASGTFVFEYNYCTLVDAKCLNFTGAAGTNTITITEKYNYYVDNGVQGTTHGEAEYAYPNNASQTINWTLEYNTAVNHYYTGGTNQTAPLSQQADAYTLATTTDHNYSLPRGTQSYTGASNSDQTASAAIFLGEQNDPATGTITGTSSNNIWEYSGAFFPFNKGSSFGGLAGNANDYNAGTGNTCTVSAGGTVTCN